jgi:hypothetical protein
MDRSLGLITAVKTPAQNRVVIDTSKNKRYHADLTSMASVHCFPKTEKEWAMVSIDPDGLALIWSSRFEVHLDQVIGLAKRVEDIQKPARK